MIDNRMVTSVKKENEDAIEVVIGSSNSNSFAGFAD